MHKIFQLPAFVASIFITAFIASIFSYPLLPHQFFFKFTLQHQFLVTRFCITKFLLAFIAPIFLKFTLQHQFSVTRFCRTNIFSYPILSHQHFQLLAFIAPIFSYPLLSHLCNKTLKKLLRSKLIFFFAIVYKSNFTTILINPFFLKKTNLNSFFQEAASLGKRVACVDFQHSDDGSVPATCMNVGRVPKKLMQQAAMVGAILSEFFCGKKSFYCCDKSLYLSVLLIEKKFFRWSQKIRMVNAGGQKTTV